MRAKVNGTERILPYFQFANSYKIYQLALSTRTKKLIKDIYKINIDSRE